MIHTPSRNLKIALLPLDIISFDSQANLLSLEKRLGTIEPDTDLVVVPEMFNTGFTSDISVLEKIAQDNNGQAISRLQQMSEEYNMAFCGSFIASDGNSYFNRGFMIFPDRETAFYDKHHLFSYGGESESFTAGKSLSPIIEFRTWRLKMSICYDIRFPAWNRCRNLDYDILVVPANWVHSRFYAWEHLLIARAIENQVYVLGCNREGKDLYGEYHRGESLIFDNWGRKIGKYREDGCVYAILEFDKFNAARNYFTPWKDADAFQIDV